MHVVCSLCQSKKQTVCNKKPELGALCKIQGTSNLNSMLNYQKANNLELMSFPGLEIEIRFLFVRREGLGSEGGGEVPRSIHL